MAAKYLVVVESPAKAQTIGRYLGGEYKVLASYGHVRDLVAKQGAVDPEQDFKMTYEEVKRNSAHMKALIKAAREVEMVLLATDPDREGEAISWHIAEILLQKKIISADLIKRVVFHEVTKGAIQQAVMNPRELLTDLVNAQQARRALDFLVGFNLSPLLWRKVKGRLSAGRVQSPALRLIVEREDEIKAFVSQEYWSIWARLKKEDKSGVGDGDNQFDAKLIQFNEEVLKKFSIISEDGARKIEHMLESLPSEGLTVSRVERKERKRHPSPPFITSTLQQEASRKLGFSTKKTMMLAQRLYEGVETPDGVVGLITYMRTDSVNLSSESITDIRAYIKGHYGDEHLPKSPRVYKTKTKNAQEAHEAIRPTGVKRVPDDLKSVLEPDQHRLYELIWRRAVASQMRSALIDGVAVEFDCVHRSVFKATGSTVKYPGFMSVYMEGQDDQGQKEGANQLPALEVGDHVDVNEINANQHFTEPPPRYTEASLVKVLEEYGIGRPSTYSSIVATIQQRGYAQIESRRFFPTDVGKIVGHFLKDYLTQYVDYTFTAQLEDQLDEISRGEKDWVPVLREFWDPFIAKVKAVDKDVSRKEVVKARELGDDPKTGKIVTVQMGRFGPYVQIGTKDDEEKPAFAGLLPGQDMDQLDLDEALKLFDLPRDLGETPEGEKVRANIGRFGPYVQFGKTYVSLKEHDPKTITLDEAMVLIDHKKKELAERVIQVFDEVGISVLNGRFGPYITDGKKNVKVPKDQDPKLLSQEVCQELIAKAPAKKGRFKRSPKKKGTTKKSE